MNKKLMQLRNILSEMGNILIAYSGGVDSTFLAKIANEELKEKVLTVTVESEIHPRREIHRAKEIIEKLGIRNTVVKKTGLVGESFRSNPRDRCYLCKKEIFSIIKEEAKKNGIKNIADGSNCDDIHEYRPGLKALREMKIRSPLQEAGFFKKDIRILSKKMDLPTWNQSSNSCMVTRLPYGEKITFEKIKKIEKAEEFMQDLGINLVRVRYHREIARIEVDKKNINFVSKAKIREKIIENFKKIGFLYVALDLEGFRSGSMDI